MISSFLHFTTAVNQKQEIADLILQRLLESQQPIQRSNWINLMSCISNDKLTCDCLKLSSSFTAFFLCSTYILRRSLHDKAVQTRVKHVFDEMITQNMLRVQLNEIVMILKRLQDPLPAHENEKELTEVIHSMIETSVALQNKIRLYLSKLIIQDTDLKLLYELFQYYHPTLLFDLDKQTYLHSTLNQHEQRSCDFYTNWFEYFLCDIHYVETEQEWSYFQLLMNKWLDKIVHDRVLFCQIMKKMDGLLERLNHIVNNKPKNRRFTYFEFNITCLLILIGSLSDAVINVGSNVQNEIFIQEFERKFKESYVLPYQHQMKTMVAINNPLITLIELNQRKEAIHLVKRLLEICCGVIKIDRDELLHNTFDWPAENTLTYVMLSENCFIEMPLRRLILDQLTKFWNVWEETGLTAREIRRWQSFTANQRYYFGKIWNVVEKFAKKNYTVDRLFDKQYQEMLEKIKIKEKIVTCLNAYCPEGSDRQSYIVLLERMQRQIDEATVQTIVIAPELKKLVPLVDRLSHISKSNAWMHFYTKQLEASTSNNNTTHERVSKNNPTTVNRQRTAMITTNVETKLGVNINTCAEVLTNASHFFDDFIAELNTVCIKWKKLPIVQLLMFFPIESVESDMEILKEFLEPDVIPNLLCIFTFWKNRKRLQDVCLGFNALMFALERFHISSNTDLKTILTDLIEINKQTISGVCYNKYHHYIETVEKTYSANILNLCAEFNVSRELIKFLNELTTTDADNLLEAVNDWDETIISTKSVIDFVNLKTFFTRAYASIEKLFSREIKLSFQDVAKCFDDIFKDDDFKNVIGLFQTCSQSVTGIKHLYLELTDKEQSKRRCIMDIMSHSVLHFVKDLRSERMFDVEIKAKNLNFDDLSELRDRARLIEYSNKNKNNQEHKVEIKQLESFVELVGVIEAVLENLSSLYVAGFPTVTEIINNKIVTFNESNYDALRQLYTTLKENLQLWEVNLCRMYAIYPELTHFSCEQFQTVESFIYNVEINEQHPGYHLLKYIGFKPAFQRATLPQKAPNENERLENLGKILATQRPVSGELEEIEDNFSAQT
ncbi:unnamed protein product, partial [Didymodactylos carnosus]